jgi:hypothetical protein
MMLQAWHFLPFVPADPLKLCKVGMARVLDRKALEGSVYSPVNHWGQSPRYFGLLNAQLFQISLEMLDQAQVQALARPLKDIQKLV